MSAREEIARLQALCDAATEGDPAWSRDLPPMPADVRFHAVGSGLAIRHDLHCPMRKVIYDSHGDPCKCRESERRCERTAEVAYAAGMDAIRSALPAALACLSELLDLPASYGPDDAPSRLKYFGDTVHAIIERHLGDLRD